MKTKPYVAIHCWKALSLRIVRRPSKFVFIQRASEKIANNNLGVYRTFPFESAGFFQSIEFGLQRPLKVHISSAN